MINFATIIKLFGNPIEFLTVICNTDMKYGIGYYKCYAAKLIFWRF
jgi:hypothetical protein